MKALVKKSVLAAAVIAAASGIAYAAPVTTTIVGTAGTGSTDIAVTASVAPTLSMDVSTASLALGVLNPTAHTGASLGIEVATNAIGGLKVTLDSLKGGLDSANTLHNLYNGSADVGGTESYQVLSSVGTWDGFTGGSASGISATEITPLAKSHVIYQSNKPERASGTNDDVTVTLQAQTDTATPAATDYADTVTLTVSATF